MSFPSEMSLLHLSPDGLTMVGRWLVIFAWITTYPFGSCSLQVARRKERCRSCVGSQSWEAVGQGNNNSCCSLSHRKFLFGRALWRLSGPAPRRGQGHLLLDQVAQSHTPPDFEYFHSGVPFLKLALMVLLPRAPDTCGGCLKWIA